MASFSPRLEATPQTVPPALRWGRSFYKVWPEVVTEGELPSVIVGTGWMRANARMWAMAYEMAEAAKTRRVRRPVPVVAEVPAVEPYRPVYADVPGYVPSQEAIEAAYQSQLEAMRRVTPVLARQIELARQEEESISPLLMEMMM